jgi:Hint domain
MSDLDNLPSRFPGSPRHLMKMGAIAASAMLVITIKTTRAEAVVCATVVRCNCFLKGTTIRTVAANRKVEDLVMGDLLPTVFGGMRPTQWIGRYPVKRNSAKGWVRDVLPINFKSKLVTA